MDFIMNRLLTLSLGFLLAHAPQMAHGASDEASADLALEKKIQALEKELEEIKFQNHLKSRIEGSGPATQKKATTPPSNDVIEGPAEDVGDAMGQDQEAPLDRETLKKAPSKKKDKQPAILANDDEAASENTPAADEEPSLEADAESEQATMYRQGRYYLSQQNTKLARKAFDEVVEKHDGTPEGVLAQFWIGEMMLAEKNYAGASLALGQAYGHLRVLNANKKVTGDIYHGESNRLPEILAKLAYSLQMVNKKKEACVIVKQLRKEYKTISPTLEWYVGNLSKDLKCKK